MLENVYGLYTVSGNTWYGNMSLWYIMCLIDSIWVHIDMNMDMHMGRPKCYSKPHQPNSPLPPTTKTI